MATRSTITVEFEDGNILSFYCHFDGYPEGLGYKLDKFFDWDTIKRMPWHYTGSISSISEVESEGKTFLVLSHMDADKPYSYSTKKEYEDTINHHEEYNYFYSEKEGKWYLMEYDYENKTASYSLLSDVLSKREFIPINPYTMSDYLEMNKFEYWPVTIISID